MAMKKAWSRTGFRSSLLPVCGAETSGKAKGKSWIDSGLKALRCQYKKDEARKKT